MLMLTNIFAGLLTGGVTFTLNFYNIATEDMSSAGTDAYGWRVIFTGAAVPKSILYGVLWPVAAPWTVLGMVSNLYNGDRILEGFVPGGNWDGFSLFKGRPIKDYWNDRR